jgi:micrococcal nuclease
MSARGQGGAASFPLAREDVPVRCIAIMAAAAMLAIGCGACASTSPGAPSSPRQAPATETGRIAYVVDGDTLRVRLAGKLTYVRLIGIDTPEDVRPGTPVECGAEAAADSMRRLAPEGAQVLLRADSVAATHDRYGRLLAHAFIARRQLEVAQLRRGWAEVYRFEGQRFDGLPHFMHAESEAERAGRGVWSACAGDFHSSR